MNEKNFEYFEERLDELIDKYADRFVVIKNESIVGVYDSFDEAYENTTKTDKLGTFIIQQCIPKEANTVTFISGNVAFA